MEFVRLPERDPPAPRNDSVRPTRTRSPHLSLRTSPQTGAAIRFPLQHCEFVPATKRRTDCHVAALLAMTVIDGTPVLNIAQRGEPRNRQIPIYRAVAETPCRILWSCRVFAIWFQVIFRLLSPGAFSAQAVHAGADHYGSGCRKQNDPQWEIARKAPCKRVLPCRSSLFAPIPGAEDPPGKIHSAWQAGGTTPP